LEDLLTRDEWILFFVVIAIVYGARLVPLAGETIGKALARRSGWKDPRDGKTEGDGT
jgi:Sec-independent protein translocase protein TatA